MCQRLHIQWHTASKSKGRNLLICSCVPHADSCTIHCCSRGCAALQLVAPLKLDAREPQESARPSTLRCETDVHAALHQLRQLTVEAGNLLPAQVTRALKGQLVSGCAANVTWV